MALLHIFTWDHAATLAGAREITQRTYPFSNIDNHTEAVPGRFGGIRGLAVQNGGFVQFDVPSTAEVFIGFAHKRFSENNGIRFIEFREGTTFHGSLQTAFNGGFRYTRSTSTQVALTDMGVLRTATEDR